MTKILECLLSQDKKNLYHSGGWIRLHLKEKQEKEDPSLVGPSETASLNPWK